MYAQSAIKDDMNPKSANTNSLGSWTTCRLPTFCDPFSRMCLYSPNIETNEYDTFRNSGQSGRVPQYAPNCYGWSGLWLYRKYASTSGCF